MPGRVESGSFWEWYHSWWEVYQLGSLDLLWISYEELLSEPEKSIDHIAEFI
ncbi:MAG: sulfotransferase domain-containing protein [bacterium]